MGPRHALGFALLMLSACGGSWSNRDLEFAQALPDKATLQAKLPKATTTQGLGGVSTRQDGLLVGDPSQAWADTRAAVGQYNGLLDLLLGLIDAVRAVPPTSRTADSRTWGPWVDKNNPGHEVQVTITQGEGLVFSWSLQARPLKGAFFTVADGHFQAMGSVRQGRGALVVHVKDFRDRLHVDSELRRLDQVDLGYLTDTSPRRVEMLFTFAAGAASGLSSLGYTAREQDDGSGSLRFMLRSTDTRASAIEVVSVWQADGAGRAHGEVREGTYLGTIKDECWDRAGAVSYFAEGWAGGQVSGQASACVMVPGY